MGDIAQDRTLTPEVRVLAGHLLGRFGGRRDALLASRAVRRAVITAEGPAFLEATAGIRQGDWRVAPPPKELLERRVELLAGTTRQELITALNAGAKSCIADLWNLTASDSWSVLRGHRNLERAARLDLAYVPAEGGRVRIDPATTTRLMVVPRPLSAPDSPPLPGEAAMPVAFLDLALLLVHCGRSLAARQGAVYLYLRDVHGHQEARLWADLIASAEDHLAVPRGTVRATVMVDSIAGALEAEEILHELAAHAGGLSLDPQGYAADHIALFHGEDRPVLPDRETIGLNAPFLRALSLLVIGACHRRGCHAIGAPSFVMPPHGPGRVRPEYLAMLTDKEREAVDGHDGTIVAHPGTVTAAMMEFNKSMPLAHQLGYLREDRITPADLVRPPEGSITVDSLVGMVRTVLRVLVHREEGKGWAIQGGRLHDRSSLRLALRLLWQWNGSGHGVITATGLNVQAALVGFLARKESGKLFPKSDGHLRGPAEQAVERLLELVTGEEVPNEPW